MHYPARNAPYFFFPLFSFDRTWPHLVFYISKFNMMPPLPLLLNRTGATTIHIFNHCIRQCADPSKQGSLDPLGRWQVIPSGHPHVDYAGRPCDLRGTLQELQFPPPIAARFGFASSSSSSSSSSTPRPRFAFINAWRPLATVRRDPLAVADAATVPAEDYRIRAREFRRTGVRSGNYVLSHHHHHHHGGEEEEDDGAVGHHHDHHQWYYMSGMREDEMVVFKGFDTKQDLPGWRCPHTAFVLDEGTKALPPRESIEVRAVCFWD